MNYAGLNQRADQVPISEGTQQKDICANTFAASTTGGSTPHALDHPLASIAALSVDPSPMRRLLSSRSSSSSQRPPSSMGIGPAPTKNTHSWANLDQRAPASNDLPAHDTMRSINTLSLRKSACPTMHEESTIQVDTASWYDITLRRVYEVGIGQTFGCNIQWFCFNIQGPDPRGNRVRPVDRVRSSTRLTHVLNTYSVYRGSSRSPNLSSGALPVRRLLYRWSSSSFLRQPSFLGIGPVPSEVPCVSMTS